MIRSAKDVVMGEDWLKVYRPLVKDILDRQVARKYAFVDLAEFKRLCRENLVRANKIYVDEILFRAHATALVSLARGYEWCRATDEAHSAGNFFSLCAALRGLMESAGDVSYSLGRATDILAANLHRILAIRSSSTIPFTVMRTVGQVLEDDLIHFLYGRRIAKDAKKTTPPSHDADKKGVTYIKAISSRESQALLALWGRLCEVTHPAMHSVLPFLCYEKTGLKGTLHFRIPDYQTLRKDILGDASPLLATVLQAAFNRPLTTLGVLNRFGIPAVSTSVVTEQMLREISGWKTLVKYMEESQQTP